MSPNANTFELATPRRPGIGDFNGAVKENAPDPPDPKTMPSAEEYNTLCRLAVAFGAVLPHTLITVRFNAAGLAIVDRFTSANGNVTLSTFTLAHPAAGDTSIRWPANAFPTPAVGPMVTANDDVDVDRMRAIPLVGPNPGVRVRTLLGTVGIDVSFTVAVY